MKIGLFQSNIAWENKQANFDRYKNALEAAKLAGVDVLFLPEMSATGFSLNIAETAEDSDGETVSFFRSECRKSGVACGFGYTERNGEKALNKYLICNSNGEIISEYTKIHPFSFGKESKSFIGGNEISIFTLCGFTISTFICYDLRFPEIFQAASKKCSIIVVAANWPASRREHWLTLLKARAIENQCYICGVNRTGNSGDIEYAGDSVIFAPDGSLISSAESDEKIITFQPDINTVTTLRTDFPLKNDRRPDIYKGFY